MNAGAIPVLVEVLNSPDTDVQYYCATTLSNIATNAKDTIRLSKVLTCYRRNLEKLAQSEPRLVQSLIRLIDSPNNKVQRQAALALRNMTVGLSFLCTDGLSSIHSGRLEPLFCTRFDDSFGVRDSIYFTPYDRLRLCHVTHHHQRTASL